MPMQPDVPSASTNDDLLVERLRDGEESAFVELISRHHESLVRIARLYVADQAAAEEVAQETWIAVLQGIHRFEGRSSLKTWIFAILTNRAKTRGRRDGRMIPFSALEPSDDEDFHAVDPDRFQHEGEDAGYWNLHPESWAEIPEDRFLSQEVQSVIRQAIEALPPNQRAVIQMRDIDGLSAEEVCNILELSQTNQRVLLHRARSRVHRALEAYLMDEGHR